jgi:chemotaxis protein MotB
MRATALLGLCVVALGGCVSQDKYDQLAKERNALIEEKRALEETIASSNEELRNLSAQAADKEAKLAEERSKLSMTSVELESIKAKAAEQEEMFAKLKKELSSELDSQKLTLRQLKTGITMDLPEDILFPSGSADLRDSGREVLAKVSAQLKDANYQIVVSGFTDNIRISGKLAERFPTNWDLAAARATNVVRLLEEKKVPASKLLATSYGENSPVASNKTPVGRKKNRRIEIHLRPVAKE